MVLNSGHTFHEKELATLNYLLFPRLGDWAVIKVPDDPSRPAAEVVVRSGFFDEAVETVRAPGRMSGVRPLDAFPPATPPDDFRHPANTSRRYPWLS